MHSSLHLALHFKDKALFSLKFIYEYLIQYRDKIKPGTVRKETVPSVFRKNNQSYIRKKDFPHLICCFVRENSEVYSYSALTLAFFAD